MNRMRMMVILFARVSRETGTVRRTSTGGVGVGLLSTPPLGNGFEVGSPLSTFGFVGSDAEVLDCMIESFQHATFAKHGEHVKQTRPDGLARDGHPTRVDQGACFDAQLLCQSAQGFVE